MYSLFFGIFYKQLFTNIEKDVIIEKEQKFYNKMFGGENGMNEQKVYIAIDLKSFYASVECVERGLDPLTTNLVVADNSRTDKTVCLAVTPSLKSYGIGGRARLFEVIQRVKEVNIERKFKIPNHIFTDTSFNNEEIKKNPSLQLDYIVAVPRMSFYMQYSSKIYSIYLKYFAPEDIYVYSIDEIFCDITNYLHSYKMTPRELVTKVINDVYDTTGITATAGIGTNLFLTKVAMDIVAKHIEPDKNGVRIAGLNEMYYRKHLWNHKPITDFWRVGRGTARSLEKYGMHTMGDIARCSEQNEDLLYKLFGVNAELLIDHAWGYEPVTIEQIKSYKPKCNSLSSGQVLHCPYNYQDTKTVVKDMADGLAFDLVRKDLVTKQIVLTIEYDTENLKNPNIVEKYDGEITIDRYGRAVPKHAHGTINLESATASVQIIVKNTIILFERIINKDLLVRKINITASNVINKNEIDDEYEQVNLFIDYEAREKQRKKELQEMKMESAMLEIRKKYGANAIFKGRNLEKSSTALERNGQIGGHKA